MQRLGGSGGRGPDGGGAGFDLFAAFGHAKQVSDALKRSRLSDGRVAVVHVGAKSR